VFGHRPFSLVRSWECEASFVPDASAPIERATLGEHGYTQRAFQNRLPIHTPVCAIGMVIAEKGMAVNCVCPALIPTPSIWIPCRMTKYKKFPEFK
jgi:hypothetical protein